MQTLQQNNIFTVLSGHRPLQIEVKKPAIEKAQEQTIRDLVLIQMLSGRMLRGRNRK
jgi:hypothetical protein